MSDQSTIPQSNKNVLHQKPSKRYQYIKLNRAESLLIIQFKTLYNKGKRSLEFLFVHFMNKLNLFCEK
uniref:Putative ovule protein n=1 Tax=Solanum chacoense TaxID=4108 RepID=A0A0V0GI85_SOLCH